MQVFFSKVSYTLVHWMIVCPVEGKDLTKEVGGGLVTNGEADANASVAGTWLREISDTIYQLVIK
jgi:hypothetical protein